MIPLTPDEVIARLGYKRPIDTREWMTALGKAGLVVVDATDTPNECGHGPVLTEIECIVGMADRDHYRRMNDEWWLNRLDGLLKSRTSADVAGSTGGSPGGRGTVTQETSADELINTVAQHIEWLRRPGAPPDNLQSADYVERLVALVMALVEKRETSEPPFPNAHPGPQVDGQPTWGVTWEDIPDPHEAWEWSITGKHWISADSDPGRLGPTGGRDLWVLVRRTPQPEARPDRWTYKERTTERCGALMRDGVLVSPVYFPGDARAMCDALNAAESGEDRAQ